MFKANKGKPSNMTGSKMASLSPTRGLVNLDATNTLKKKKKSNGFAALLKK